MSNWNLSKNPLISNQTQSTVWTIEQSERIVHVARHRRRAESELRRRPVADVPRRLDASPGGGRRPLRAARGPPTGRRRAGASRRLRRHHRRRFAGPHRRPFRQRRPLLQPLRDRLDRRQRGPLRPSGKNNSID